MINIILTLVLLGILGGAALYVYKAKKRGEKCIGCPYAKQCTANNCNCSNSKETE